MTTLTVRYLEDAIAQVLRMRAAEHGRSAEVEHREILRTALASDHRLSPRVAAAARLAEFRHRTANRGAASATELLRESREGRRRTPTGLPPEVSLVVDASVGLKWVLDEEVICRRCGCPTYHHIRHYMD